MFRQVYWRGRQTLLHIIWTLFGLPTDLKCGVVDVTLYGNKKSLGSMHIEKFGKYHEDI